MGPNDHLTFADKRSERAKDIEGNEEKKKKYYKFIVCFNYSQFGSC
jgi:hypothetical protein